MAAFGCGLNQSCRVRLEGKVFDAARLMRHVKENSPLRERNLDQIRKRSFALSCQRRTAPGASAEQPSTTPYQLLCVRLRHG